ncbi:MAG TPA: hypothetical protein VEK56_09295 [Vicinamibacterales bacterium]|nr:hypothetical protein [Vicinamibacterales bacterium]
MSNEGQVNVFYLFDVSESLDLTRATALLDVPSERARLRPKPAIPAYVKYQIPPLQVEGEALAAGGLEDFRVRFKLFDYGVISLSLTRPLAASWDDLPGLAHRLSTGSELEAGAERLCRRLLDRIQLALDRPRDRFLSEDYVVFVVTAMPGGATAHALLTKHGAVIAQALRAELQPLSGQEREEVLRHRLSYHANDLVIPTWNAALIYDMEPGALGALEILEYANSQLLQFRYYDELLDSRVAKIYDELESTKHYRSWWPRRYTRAAREVHALFIDVNELTDRTENALKLVGDVYAARLLALAHTRLGVDAWRTSVHDKLKTLDAIYRFAVDQTGMERGELLEIAIVVILVFELVLFFLGIMR